MTTLITAAKETTTMANSCQISKLVQINSTHISSYTRFWRMGQFQQALVKSTTRLDVSDVCGAFLSIPYVFIHQYGVI